MYSDLAIETCLSLRLVFDLPLRQTQGFVTSLFALMDIQLPVPDYSTLSRREEDLSVDLQPGCFGETGKGDIHLILDSTGLKAGGEGEWKQRTHGKQKRRTWRKLHNGTGSESGQITATKLTGNAGHDSSQAGPLLEETGEHTDGGYDTWECYGAIGQAGATPTIPPQKNAKIKKHGNCNGPPLPRDAAI